MHKPKQTGCMWNTLISMKLVLQGLLANPPVRDGTYVHLCCTLAILQSLLVLLISLKFNIFLQTETGGLSI